MSSEATKLANKKPEQMTDEDYNARWDAQTLASAEVIKADAARLKRAQAWAEVLVAQEKAEASAMQKVAEQNA